MRALSAPPPDSNGVGDRSQARMCGEPSSPADRARPRRRRRCASSRRISDLSVNAPQRPHRRCSASNLCGRGNFARSGCRSAAGGEAVDDVLGAVTAIPLIWGSDGRLERNRKFVDSPLEEAVCCELVSEVELGKSGFWGSDGKMGLFPRRSAYLRDCYYTYFSNAGIAAAADFPVYQRERWLD